MNFNIIHIGIDNIPYVDYETSKICDMIDNIEVTSSSDIIDSINYIIGGQIFKSTDVKEFVRIASIFHNFIIQIKLKKVPELTDTFDIKQRHYLMKNNIRSELVRNSVSSDSIIYSRGITGRVNNDDIITWGYDEHL